MRRLFIRDCEAGDVLEDVFVISGKQLAQGKDGKYYIKATISDRTGQLHARMWSATRQDFAAMPESGFLRIRARVENYQSNLQCIIEQFRPPEEGTFDIGDLLPRTTKDVGQMCTRLTELLQSIQNRHLAALVQAYLDDQKLMADFCKSPAAMSFHHAWIGGLLEHTLNAMEVADALCRFYPGLNRDLVIAGIFLHDIAKTWELRYDSSFAYTDGGQLVGHIVKSAMWVEHKAREAEKMLCERIPQPLIDVIQHIIISHHGTPEFGAIKPPSTPEAVAVHMIENMDAKLTMSLGATRGEGGGEGNWTEYMKAFGGRLYRPDVAPAETTGEELPIEEMLAPAEGVADRSEAAHPDAPPAEEAPVILKITNPLFQAVPEKRQS